MKTQQINFWGPGSASYWLTMVVAVGIIFIGLRFILAPNVGADGFGVALPHTYNAVGYAYAKGIRDIYSGIILMIFLILRKASATAIVFSAAIIIPASDFLTILSVNGVKDITHLLIHGGTAVYMMITSIFLFTAKSKN